MPHLSSPAILLRATEHGDFDKIITFFTLKRGKTALMAKRAKKSVKRFAGVLELFSVLNVVWAYGRSRGLPILEEASIVKPFEQIRGNITDTSFASYWCELVCQWMEEGQKQVSVYKLLEYALDQLDSNRLSHEILHITFQLRFMAENGFRPNFDFCAVCRTTLDRFERTPVAFHVRLGGLLCEKCNAGKPGNIMLSKGTIKLLSWVLNVPLSKVGRVRFSGQAVEEGLNMLETFVPYHIGKETKSLKFLKQLRTG